MSVRTALPADIPQLHRIRMNVRENVLRNPALVTKKDYEEFLTISGKGWLYETENEIAGFAILDTKQQNVWALFVDPLFEKKGIGRALQDTMLHWFFENNSGPLWLSTAPGTRAETFYRKSGWRFTGMTKSGECRFEMSAEEWQRNNR